MNHSQNFVDPESGSHTNRIEGTWTHVKNRAQRRGGRRSPDHLARDLTEFMWLRQKGLLSSADRARLMFARELPQLFSKLCVICLTLFSLTTIKIMDVNICTAVK